MSNAILKVQVLAKSELALAQIRAERTTRRAAMFAIAGVFGLLCLGMANVAGYLALCSLVAPSIAALLVALADAAIAGVIALAARGAGRSVGQEKLAREMRAMAYAELNNDIEQVKAEVERISTDVRRISSTMSAISNGVFGTIAPLMNLLFRSGRRK
jgi:hypothetical protein